MAVDPQHRYSNEAEIANWDIYDGFKLKKPFGLHGLYNKYFSSLRVKYPDHHLLSDLAVTKSNLTRHIKKYCIFIGNKA